MASRDSHRSSPWPIGPYPPRQTCLPLQPTSLSVALLSSVSPPTLSPLCLLCGPPDLHAPEGQPAFRGHQGTPVPLRTQLIPSLPNLWVAFPLPEFILRPSKHPPPLACPPVFSFFWNSCHIRHPPLIISQNHPLLPKAQDPVGRGRLFSKYVPRNPGKELCSLDGRSPFSCPQHLEKHSLQLQVWALE